MSTRTLVSLQLLAKEPNLSDFHSIAFHVVDAIIAHLQPPLQMHQELDVFQRLNAVAIASKMKLVNHANHALMVKSLIKTVMEPRNAIQLQVAQVLNNSVETDKTATDVNIAKLDMLQMSTEAVVIQSKILT